MDGIDTLVHAGAYDDGLKKTTMYNCRHLTMYMHAYVCILSRSQGGGRYVKKMMMMMSLQDNHPHKTDHPHPPQAQ